MLSKADDFPIHQNPEPIAYAGVSRNFYDRYFFNGYHLEEDIFFALGMGIYPQLDVMDAGFSLIIEGVQHNLLCSRVLNHERMDTQVGDIAVEVIKPLECLRIVIDSPTNDLSADLLFTGRAPAQEEPRFTRRIGTQTVMDYTRLTQNGNWQGWIEFRGRKITVTPELWLGTRDRSWGIRPVGAADTQPNPHAPAINQFYWLWAPINWPDAVSLYHLNDDAEGKPWNTAGVFVPLTGDAESMRKVSSQLAFIPGTRHAQSARITLQRFAGGVAEITMRPRFHWYMKGVGYGHPEYGHGRYHGGPAQLFEEYTLAEVDDAMNLHIQAICDVSMEGDFGTRQGKGVLEQLILGPHAPSGFTKLMDMAP
ncbi:MAG: hypothetical protein VYC16_06450 [Pseudomonadota bacterium]|nr:hypothetical protein [Pseudomonadota bacterium]